MAVKGVSVDLEEDLHRAVKAAATSRGMLTPEAYTEALRRWLDAMSGPVESPYGDLTHDEDDYLRAVLNYVRTDSDRVLMPSLDGLVTRMKAHHKPSPSRKGSA